MIWPQLIMWVISFLLTDYFRERLPSQTPSGIGDFNIPTATEGRPVPIITGGTVRCDAPNCIWYGDFVAVERTTSTGIVFKRDEVIGYEYELSMQYALFKGESVGITAIYIGDEKVFDMVDDAGGIPQEVVDVDKPDLFGGKDQGGGFQGRIRLNKGSETQAVDAFLDTHADLDPLPAYRGLSYVVISNIASLKRIGAWLLEDIPAEIKGANFGEANQIRYVRVEVQTFDDLAGTAGSPGLGDTMNLANDHHFIGPDLNPIVVAWDLWTNTRWGRGFGLADVNLANFKAAAETCWTEGLGWTNLIDEQTTTGAIQDKIEQHIDGYIGPNPITGQIEVSLARPDYSIPALPLVDDNNLLEVKEWSQGDWSNTKNRIRIRYTSRSKSWKETHAVETAAGNRIIQGRTVTEEIRFEGCHTDAVAAIIAARAKRGLSIPLQKGTIVVDRTGYTFKPGQPFRLTSDQTKTVDLPVRVTRIAYGDMVRQSIELSVVEDIFGNEIATVAENPPSDFVPPVQNVIPFTTDSQAALEPPALLMVYDDLPGITPRVATMARRNAGNRPTEYATLQRNAAGAPAGAYTSLTPNIIAGFCAVGTLRNPELGGQPGQGALTIEIDPFSGESLDGLIGSYDPRGTDARGVAVISPGLADEEFIIFQNVVDSGGGIELQDMFRSAMDTPWKAHAAGAGVWFIWTGGFGMNEFTYLSPRNVEIKLLPISPNASVLEAAAIPLPIVAIDSGTGNRSTKPLLPVNLDLPDGSPFPAEVNFDGTIVPQSGPNYVGSQLVPLHRLANNPDIRSSVEGFTIAGIPAVEADFDDQVLDISVWIHDLDQNPGASRASAVFSELNQLVVLPNTEVQLAKADLVAGGAIGIEFNARIEIETRDSRPSSPALNISHEPLFFDFLATGVFTLEPIQAVMSSQFNGNDTDAFIPSDGLGRPALFVGGAQIDTASSVYGGASLIFDGVDSAVHLVSGIDFDWYDGEWTIDFRFRFDDVAGTQVLLGQAWIAPGRTFYLQWAPNAFILLFSRTGSNGPFTNIPLGSFTPVAGTWYTGRIVQQKKPSSPRFSMYVDGTRIGSTFTAQSHTDSGHDWILGALHTGGGNYSNFFTGQIDNFEVRPFPAVDPDATSYTVDTNRPSLGPVEVADPLLATFEGLDLDTAYRSDDPSRWDMTFGGTSEIDTAQFMFGTSSLRCDGFNSLTPALCDGVWINDTLFPATPNQAWNLDRKPWTMQAFVRYNTAPNAGPIEGAAMLGKYNRPSGNQVDWGFFVDGNDDLSFYYSHNGNITGGVSNSVDIGALVTGVWYHFVAQRVGDNLELLFDGNRVLEAVGWFTSQTDDFIFNQVSNPVTIGRFYDASSLNRVRALDGWIDGVDVHVGSNLYSGATYTIPTAPRIPGDQGDRDLLLLHHFEGGDFFATDRQQQTDDGQRGTRITFISGGRYLDANAKFGVTHGDAGVDDGLAFTESKFYWALADGDFTIDIWFQNNDTEAQQANNGVAFFNHWLESGDNRGWRLSFDKTTSRLEFIWTTDGTTGDERTAFVSSFNYDATFQDNATYVHVAVERDGGVINIYLNGVIQTLDGASDIIGADVIFNVAQRAIQVGIEDESTGNKTANGYWDEFRIVKRAEYGSSSFTPEVAPYVAPVFPNV